ncbi:MAG TPA: helix-hairpin-helix domain-containing protein [Acidimicrobiia bacterium]|jgi:predicted flap endonuclease-1-like 5' DNA nuclease
MRRLLRVAGVAAALGALAWWMRERLLPPPLVDTEPPPPFRGASPVSADAPTASGRGLEAVRGIGPVYAGRLASIGIGSLEALADAEASFVAAELEIPAGHVADWIAQAAALSR